MNEIGQRFVVIRKNLGLTQKKMADRLDVSIGAVQGYEYGQIPKGEVLKKFSDWGYDLNWFFTGLGEMMCPKNDFHGEFSRKIAWNVAYYLCQRTEATNDPSLFADVFLELHDWMEKNHQKPESDQASDEVTAQIIDFAMQRLNIR
jgi:transcriptional regulator with XRE-family HTH domain